MNRTQRPLFCAILLALNLGTILRVHAEKIFQKDGKVLNAIEIRRDGAFVFLKVANAEGGVTETLVPLNQVERIEFPESAALAEARQLWRGGDAKGVLDKTAEVMNSQRVYRDVPGNQWVDVIRLRLPAIALESGSQAFEDLQKDWAPTGDEDLDIAFRLLVAGRTDPAGAQVARKALAKPGAASLAAGLSWLDLGEAALKASRWKDAVRCFLSVEVFLPNQRLLQPKALFGAIKGFIGSGERAKAAALVEELKAEYPSTPEVRLAAELLR